MKENEDISSEMIEAMSSKVHEAWLSRNDWVYDEENGNPDQAKPYEELSEEEKAKDREQIIQAITKVSAWQRREIDIAELKKKYMLDERAKKETELAELQETDQKCDEALALVEELDKEQEGQTQGEE